MLSIFPYNSCLPSTLGSLGSLKTLSLILFSPNQSNVTKKKIGQIILTGKNIWAHE